MTEITHSQQKVLDYCRAYQATQDNFPTTRRIARHFGWASYTAAANHIRALLKKGFLERTMDGNIRFVRIMSHA